jgi:hypothetical protein
MRAVKLHERELTSSMTPGSDQALFSRIADTCGVFSVVLLPADAARSFGNEGAADREAADILSVDDEREMFNMDGILAELKRELQEERDATEVKYFASGCSNQRIAELEHRIAQGEKLLQATKEVVVKRNAQVKACD